MLGDSVDNLLFNNTSNAVMLLDSLSLALAKEKCL